MHMGLQLLTVALESGHIANYQSLLVLVKDELCRHLFQVESCSGGTFLRGDRWAERRGTLGSTWPTGCALATWSSAVCVLCLLQLLSVERMNLYASSIRLCFLLFESMRIHLKFQLEVTISAWPFHKQQLSAESPD